MGRNKNDLIGQTFNRLTVVSIAGKSKCRATLWECHCVCGNKTVARGNALKSGTTKSCGCLRNEQSRLRFKEKQVTHGKSKHPLYKVWAGMKERCYNSNYKQYIDYGGRGITVCERWKDSFQNFYNDMVDNYQKGLQLDRIDVNGNYEPLNCRWVTQQQNKQNKRAYKGCSSKYKGVSWHKSSNSWIAQIGHNGKQKHLGCFKTEIEAAKAYNEKAIELFGDFACLNLIEE